MAKGKGRKRWRGKLRRKHRTRQPRRFKRPPCSVKGCKTVVTFFLQPSVDGMTTDGKHWASCKDHVQPICASAAQEGIDVSVLPFRAIEMNRTDAVAEMAEAAAEVAARDMGEGPDEVRARVPDEAGGDGGEGVGR